MSYYYPKNYNANGYGWVNTLALQSGMDEVPPTSDESLMGSNSSGVSSLYPSMQGLQLSYGFAPNVVAPKTPTDDPYYPILGFIDDSQRNAGLKRRKWEKGQSFTGEGLEEPEIKAIKVTDSEVMNHIVGIFRNATDTILKAAAEAATDFIQDAINECACVKRDAEVKRKLPSLLNMKILGERGSGSRARSQVQDYQTIQNQCLREGVLFEDPDFPAEDSSIMYSGRPERDVEWRRPTEICDDPKFFFEGYSRFDVQQGELGDCWLLAATANLTMDQKIFSRVVPDDQTFEENYAGVFHFRFWQYGRWIDVVIDDRLPTYRGHLLYMRSTEQNEFWSALLEKAYAKLHGSYEALKGGTTCEAMEDFTGGVTEMYELKEAPPGLFNILLKGYQRLSMIACSLEPDPTKFEAATPQGLIKGHAYSITKVELMDIVTPNTTGKIPMLRLRNPWGNEAEWNGAWSDKSPEWRYIPEHVKQKIGLTFDHDGEFWMSYRDFVSHFDRVEMCNLSPDSLSEEQINNGKKKWEMSVFEGEWTKGVTAGGCRNFLETFWHNPQYAIALEDPDEDDDEGLCTVIVALMQKNRRSKKSEGIDCLTIGFAIYSVTERDLANKPLKKRFFQYNASVAKSPAFINLREVSCRFKLPPGHYLIVPSTFDPHEEGEFLIRVFSECKNNMMENDEEIGVGSVDDRVEPAKPEYRPHDPERLAIEKLFLEIAGEDGEIDWLELKGILDRSMRDHFPEIMKCTAKSIENPTQNVPLIAPSPKSKVIQTETYEPTIFDSFFDLLQCKPCLGTTFESSDNRNSGGGDAGAKAFGGGEIGTQALLNKQQGVITQEPKLTNCDKVLEYGGFSKDVCRSMIAMLDTDQSGRLGFEEFRILITDVRKWRDVFKLYDHDSSGKLSAFELRTALNSAGYSLNNRILNALAHRYGSRDGMIQFDDFIMCAIKMKTMIEIFKERDVEGANMATFSMQEWVEKTVYS